MNLAPHTPNSTLLVDVPIHARAISSWSSKYEDHNRD